jgi:putative addiction module killer protein
MSKIIIENYATNTGKEPFEEWLITLDKPVRAIVRTRLNRLLIENFGDCKLIKGSRSLWELRINFGAGYRVYFGKQGYHLVILLVGGDKGSQSRDIHKATKYWLDYKKERL